MMKKFLLLALCAIMLAPSLSFAQSLGERLSGKLLLQVEQGGRIWYISPEDNKRYEVTFANALSLFQEQALGITDADLAKIPITKHSGSTTFGKRFSGHLLLQVEQGGRIWYIDFKGYRWEITWDNLMNVFKSLSLGITNKDLETIPSAIAAGVSPSVPEPDDDPNYVEDNHSVIAEPLPTQPIVTYTPPVVNKPGLLRILEDFDALTPTEMVQIYNSLGQNDILTLSIYEAFGGLMHYKMCTEYPNQLYQSVSNGAKNCNLTVQFIQNTLQYISLESYLQNADTERMTMLNANSCASGQTDAATCSMYANATQNMNNMTNNTFERINMNFGNQCYVGVDEGCTY